MYARKIFIAISRCIYNYSPWQSQGVSKLEVEMSVIEDDELEGDMQQVLLVVFAMSLGVLYNEMWYKR